MDKDPRRTITPPNEIVACSGCGGRYRQDALTGGICYECRTATPVHERPIVSSNEITVTVSDAVSPEQCGICPSRDRVAVIRFGQIAICVCYQHERTLKDALDRQAMNRTSEQKQIGQQCKACGGRGVAKRKHPDGDEYMSWCTACGGTGRL